MSQALQSSDETASTESTISNSKAVTFPADFPADFPIYDGATFGEITRIHNEESTLIGHPNTAFYVSLGGNPDKIYAWYKSELASKGWKITESSNDTVLTADMGDPETSSSTSTASIYNVSGKDISLILTIIYWK